ncbi:iron-regulated protein A precursor [Bdellovibrio sp. qaytius]|nr:iron-regulated protein A precursor [Bdellovibrio sp. qaytius]
MKIMNLVLSTLLFSAVATAGTVEKQVIENVSTNVILQTYADLAARSAEMLSAVKDLAADRTQANLVKAQNAWIAARTPWESSESFLYGPVDSLGIDPMIDTWPLSRIDLDSVLASGNTINADFVRNLGVNLQGFHTLEYLLFGDGLKTNTKDVASLTQGQFDYLIATATLHAEYTHKLFYAWTTQADPDDASLPGYIDVISKPGFDNPIYSSEQAVLFEYVNGMLGILDEVANGKLSDPLGGDIDHANVELVESPYSWNSLADFEHNIESVYSVYTGTYHTHKGPGLKDVIAQTNPELANRVEARIVQAMAKIKAIGGNDNTPYNKAILNAQGRALTTEAINDLNDLRQLVENEVLPIFQ